ncbi:superoxide dismutase [Mn], mitochondrial [Pavlovales sp. CCMP2436]|nr:superoxide dismutase [Mn], mitochondrial [Pavlovales sp. CCMP2436]
MQKYTLPDLPYAASALEPAISGEIMTIHHSKHHTAYVTNLNVALEKYAEAETKGDLAAMVALQSAIKFNGGRHINHSIFWTNLAPVASGGGNVSNSPTVSAMINAQWGSLDAFKTAFSAQCVAVQGSGWGWLGYNKAEGALKIDTTANQDPLSTLGLVPLLGVDVWEHAYYMQYKNVRLDDLKSIWSVVQRRGAPRQGHVSAAR